MSRIQRASSTRRNFYELVLEGNPERVSGVLIGLHLASPDDGVLYFSYDEGVSCSLGDKLLGMVGAAAIHAIVDSSMRSVIKQHRKVLENEHRITIVEEKRIRAARLGFHYHAYARPYGAEIQKLLESLPSGVKIEGGAPEETVDESARGLEAYTPTHHYEVEGRGTVSGRIDHVIDARHHLASHALVHVGSVKLDLY